MEKALNKKLFAIVTYSALVVYSQRSEGAGFEPYSFLSFFVLVFFLFFPVFVLLFFFKYTPKYITLI